MQADAGHDPEPEHEDSEPSPSAWLKPIDVEAEAQVTRMESPPMKSDDGLNEAARITGNDDHAQGNVTIESEQDGGTLLPENGLLIPPPAQEHLPTQAEAIPSTANGGRQTRGARVRVCEEEREMQ
ncbi:hypothetical protein ONZ45_g15640 [Pleurotus djamor]|nr:hypothetical protein ONZ45_g15640 [Pleurotus djamor]